MAFGLGLVAHPEQQVGRVAVDTVELEHGRGLAHLG